MKFYTNFSNFNRELWSSFVESHSNNNIFQSFEMVDFWNGQKNHKPICFFVEADDGECLAFCNAVIMSNGRLLIKTISKRAIIFGGPLIKKGSNKKEILDFLLENIENYLKKKSIYIEIRNFYNFSYLKESFTKNNWNYLPYQNYKIHLSSEEDVFKRLKPEKRRQIRKALRENVEISYDKSEENIFEVYNILVKIYKKRAKKPIPNLSFFTNLLAQDFAGVVCVKFENKIIGGSFFLKDNNAIYDWYRGGLDYEYKKRYPSTLAAWAIIKYGLDHKLSVFDFMGAGIKGEEYGVRTFKSQFGGDLVEYGRYIKINNQTIYSFGKMVFNVLQGRKGNFKNKGQNNIENTNFHPVKIGNVEYKIITNFKLIDKDKWSKFNKDHPQGNIFQSPYMYKVHNETENYESFIYALVNANDDLMGVLSGVTISYLSLKTKFSSRNVIQGGPIVLNNNEKYISCLLDYFNATKSRNTLFTEIRNFDNQLNENDAFQLSSYRFEDHLNYLIDLSIPNDERMTMIDKSKRKSIRKAEKFGVTFELVDTTNELRIKEAYSIIEDVYEKAKLPLPNIDIFLSAAKKSSDENALKIFSVNFEGNIAGVRFALTFKDTIFGWYAGSYSKFYKYSPNELLAWKTLEWGHDNGFKVFDYGGAGKPNIPYGVRNFKSKFGGELTNYGRYNNIYHPKLFKLSKFIFNVLQFIR